VAATFPSGQGSDFAGVVEELGPDVEGFKPGTEVIGFSHGRASHAELVVADAEHLTLRPSNVPWEVAGALYVVGVTAYACIQAVNPQAGETVVVSGAAGGVGTLTVQLARNAGARVIALASEPHHQWLIHHDAIPVTYGEGVAERIRTAAEGRIDAFIDTFGANYIELALELGVQPQRINTIINWPAAQKFGTKAAGSMDASNAQVLAELATLLSQGRLEIPIARLYPLADVRQAFSELEERHTIGKIVLWCSAADPLPGR
jgi:NADPH:quinone reductase-like Zn-dependent oxidoreductase